MVRFLNMTWKLCWSGPCLLLHLSLCSCPKESLAGSVFPYLCTFARASSVAWAPQDCRILLQCRGCSRCGFDPWVRKIHWRREWQPTPVFLPGKIPWQATKSWTQLKQLSAHTHTHTHTHTHSHTHTLHLCLGQFLCLESPYSLESTPGSSLCFSLDLAILWVDLPCLPAGSSAWSSHSPHHSIILPEQGLCLIH